MVRSSGTPLAALPADTEFGARVAAGEAVFAVVGLGYTGLPVACTLAARGCDVIGIDIDAAKVEALAENRSYLPDVADADIAAVAERLHPSTDPQAIEKADVVLVCVPTPLLDDDRPDLSAVQAAFASLRSALRPGGTVILQSTVPAGTTARFADDLAEATGLRIGQDVFVAFSPERIDPAARHGWKAANTPRVVGGMTPRCTERAAAAIEFLCGAAHRVDSPVIAELAKLLENTYRLVNISFANEYAQMCRDLGVPVREVIAAAATKPFGFLPHQPGAGIGGECIPVDPVFLLSSVRREHAPMPLTALARRLAQDRPDAVSDIAKQAVGAGRALVLGVAYKPNVDDVRNSPSVRIIEHLTEQGVGVDYCDPFVPQVQIGGRTLTSLPLSPGVVEGYDCVVLGTCHDVFVQGIDWQSARRVVDPHAILPPVENVIRA